MSAVFHQGWAGEDEAARAWQTLGPLCPSPSIVGDQQPVQAGFKVRVWDAIRRVLGSDMPTHRQETGDCVAVSTAELLGATQCIEIANGEAEEFHPIFAPFLYATGRVLVGGNQLRNRGAGSVGSWQAKAVERFGALGADEPGVPRYSGSLADSWGNDDGEWRRWLPQAADNKIGSVTRLMSWEQLVKFAQNGYFCTMASSLGFEMMARSDGFHRLSGNWEHQMGIWCVCNDARKPYVGVKNQWGDVHGRLKDFDDGTDWPAGMLRVRADDIERAFTRGEVMAYSQFSGFPAREAGWKSWATL